MSTYSICRPMNAGIAALIILALVGCTRHDDPRLATPKSAARTMFQAMYDNDYGTARSCVTTGPGERDLTDGMTKFMYAMRRASDAAIRRYGDEYKKLSNGTIQLGQIDPSQIDTGVETDTGQTATIVLAHGKTTLHLLQSGKEWHVDMAQTLGRGADLSDPQLRQLVAKMFTAMAKAADDTRAEIDAGQYLSARPAVQALVANVQRALKTESLQAKASQ